MRAKTSTTKAQQCYLSEPRSPLSDTLQRKTYCEHSSFSKLPPRRITQTLWVVYFTPNTSTNTALSPQYKSPINQALNQSRSNSQIKNQMVPGIPATKRSPRYGKIWSKPRFIKKNKLVAQAATHFLILGVRKWNFLQVSLSASHLADTRLPRGPEFHG